MDEFDVMRELQKMGPKSRKRVLAWAKSLNGDAVLEAVEPIVQHSPKMPEVRETIIGAFRRDSLPKTEQELLRLMKPNRKYRPVRLAKRMRKSAGYISGLLSGLARAGFVVKIQRGVYKLP